MASQKVLQASTIPGAHTSHPLAHCGGQNSGAVPRQGGDRSGQGSSDPSLGPQPHALEVRWEQAMMGTGDDGSRRCRHRRHRADAARVRAVAGELRGAQASLHVLGEGRAPISGNGNEKYFRDCRQRTWASPSLLLGFFLLFFFSLFFLNYYFILSLLLSW